MFVECTTVSTAVEKATQLRDRVPVSENVHEECEVYLVHLPDLLDESQIPYRIRHPNDKELFVTSPEIASRPPVSIYNAVFFMES
ncbi:hypothetical protein DAPPUDRAFT_313135 [Daphnia pulex]|uniref:Uncharacterized protein n=1 Tax=Daphnia pulex TaxID=6669 RepID=E9G2Y0_DAPPU|nr:hypothetical protein DAPPUDRAFT_313135 [Daphnia pulex]|eukprot:EFX86427.1 hypothetical protein DAPPUDRAFT_313135 [Daphnia pulex]